MPNWNFHDLRHATLSLLQATGAHPFTIMSILGHTKIDTTLLYEAQAEPLQREAMEKLSKLLSANPSTEGIKPGIIEQIT